MQGIAGMQAIFGTPRFRPKAATQCSQLPTMDSSHAKTATGNCLASLRADEIHRPMHRCLWNVNKNELISYANCAAAPHLSLPIPPHLPRRDSSTKKCLQSCSIFFYFYFYSLVVANFNHRAIHTKHTFSFAICKMPSR